MITAANVICYVQPVTTEVRAAGTAWVDVNKTAAFRGRATSFAEAEAIIEEAVTAAKAMGRRMCIKVLVNTAMDADRAPAKVKRLQGSRLVGG